ncbi:hypothetical protein K504DRAFT_387988 [Pleomassaria siparia CBS 279.74]|uniref:Neprosin PEP catalytic domain-containing protein n=1 Tax=Pleomassaria siparia CBS 279.74 TaxID=1314801 RepID=A0A6G1JY04_9PLEO|nr:hypothetical protein K504DRAFT_387988 [Pleomassaria siparia CBS 279.74]
MIDWVVPESQLSNGVIATPPAPPIDIQSTSNISIPLLIVQKSAIESGPEGTVPRPRAAATSILKRPPPSGNIDAKPKSKRAAGDHWYASTSQLVDNFGGRAAFNIWKAFTQSDGDFSLIQSAVIRENVPKPGNNAQLVVQTVEAGWINYPGQIRDPHIFTFFTTDGYGSFADNTGGWNSDVRGWVQYDSVIYPGYVFTTLSTYGGTQYEVKIQWLFSGGNWWLWVLDRWIGYYPGSLFSANTDAARSLATKSNRINFYGEIYDSHPTLTTTDMGSGNFADRSFGSSCFIRQVAYTNTLSVDQSYDGSAGRVVSDTSRYSLATFLDSGDWGSYMYLGGPGAGGIVNG